ncbi:MAG: MerR family transcriptional regulator [Treponema sp.]|uniref:MerR family transcriptional regulator n=1 Tax=Treponema sp. TaxID=166 RepID=UPI001D290ABD|nr:MerR family transcriptional regulator [Treponema sp.]MBS7310673.1 MerR family transcriptional regulator [Treponema sp.]MCI5696319.1 MerR family transcriptional regulator [Spirochaetia bacterium]MDD5812435.1 MerR family transcriptional regulator [Treponema sp.]MDY5886000.1 MerR family transcriptional regulator [Treponema sp.]
MANYSIGQVEELTGIKSHVLRYWEEVIPGFAPQKDFGGRRVYSQKEVDMINRLNFLINEKKFTIEGARDQIIAESQIVSENFDIMQDIHELRQELSDILLTIKKYRNK